MYQSANQKKSFLIPLHLISLFSKHENRYKSFLNGLKSVLADYLLDTLPHLLTSHCTKCLRDWRHILFPKPLYGPYCIYCNLGTVEIVCALNSVAVLSCANGFPPLRFGHILSAIVAEYSISSSIIRFNILTGFGKAKGLIGYPWSYF